MEKIVEEQGWKDSGKVGEKVGKSEWESGVLHDKYRMVERIHKVLRVIYTGIST